MATAGVTAGVGTVLVHRAVWAVLHGERAQPATIHVNFLSSQRMRALNRRTFGRDCSTDVIAFGLAHDGRVIGDVYVCPPAARSFARSSGVPLREELVRVIVHGTLHVLGYDHPDHAGSDRSKMWRRQEHYVRRVLERP